MFSGAIFNKTVRDHRWHFGLATLAAVTFPIAFLGAFSSLPVQMLEQFLKVPFIARLISIFGGMDIGETFSFTGFGAFIFAHPLILAISWAVITMPTTRVLTGEIENGTADLLLTLPVSRGGVYFSSTLAVTLVCPILPAAVWLGIFTGSRLVETPEPIDVIALWPVAVNSCAMLFSVSGMAAMVGAMSERRGRAAGVLFAILVLSFLLNWLATMWPASAGVARLSLLRYFRPLSLLSGGGVIVSDLVTLVVLGVLSWSIGGVIYRRRDIHAG